ncbi:FAD-binding protein [Mycobacterium sp.]|uniref:FAD-binding protein n=1 Tax=Mycobacterium sp. TaxID=1785 RepID=UPI0011F5097D|nr:FAD-binding protein [Mycobacterium sp.]TAM65108.1 MAG: FAD-binding protein [Mycobacterium sp.]
MAGDRQDWDVVTDCVMVGSGGGSMCAALAADAAGLQTLVLEKADVMGGSTAMSGGILWLPDNPVSRRTGVQDSRADALRYFANLVGHDLPSTSEARVAAFLDAVDPMVEFLEAQGIPFRHCEGYSDYNDELPGGKARGRSIETELFDTTQLGPWQRRLRVSDTLPAIPMFTSEVAPVVLGGRTLRSAWTAVKVGARMAGAATRRRTVYGSGVALQGWMLLAALRADIPVWTSTPVQELITDDGGRVVGVTATRHGKLVRIRANHGVLINVGGFSHNEAMRGKYGRQPASTKWTVANPGDTGEIIEDAMRLGAATGLMDEAWWIPSSVQPDGSPLYAVYERSKPHAIMVDSSGQRYTNEAASYMAVGQAMYERNKDVPAVPSWWVMDSNNRRRYMWGLFPGGFTPRKWLSSGYIRKADTLEGLAVQCGIDPTGLSQTVERFNSFAVDGKDPDFHKGERAYDRYYGDPRTKPNPCVAPVSKPPFYAVALYPGDVGTSGGLLTDEHARVIDRDGQVIGGLYATGNCTASVMGRTYPGAGASIGASFAFGWIAAQHILNARQPGDHRKEAVGQS